jgi:ABC-type phosphate/phosphonate transport system permease subunit
MGIRRHMWTILLMSFLGLALCAALAFVLVVVAPRAVTAMAAHRAARSAREDAAADDTDAPSQLS